MRYELSDYEWTTIKPMLPNKPRGVPRVRREATVGVFATEDTWIAAAASWVGAGDLTWAI